MDGRCGSVPNNDTIEKNPVPLRDRNVESSGSRADRFSFFANFAKLGLCLLSVCGTLVLLEFGIRIIAPQDLGYWDSSTFRRVLDSSPHFVENIPNSSANFIGVPVSINSNGLRGDEIKTPKPPHTVRIVAVGDSITFGYGIRIEDTYAKVLEKRLNEEGTDGTRYEVLNGGTLGGSLLDYLHFLDQKAESLQPDIVLIGLCLNDILVYSESGVISGGEEWDGHHRAMVHRLNHFALRHSDLYTLAYSGLKTILYASGIVDMNKSQGANFVALAPPSDYQTKAWKSSLNMLQRISAFCDKRGYKLMIVVFPMQMQISDADLNFYRTKYHLRLGDGALAGDPQERLRTFAAATGIVLVDLLPVYRSYDSKDLYLQNKKIRFDATHPSVKGNQIAANEILRTLKNTNQLGGSTGDRRENEATSRVAEHAGSLR
jgi:lysophospholipase L1-like esterase